MQPTAHTRVLPGLPSQNQIQVDADRASPTELYRNMLVWEFVHLAKIDPIVPSPYSFFRNISQRKSVENFQNLPEEMDQFGSTYCYCFWPANVS